MTTGPGRIGNYPSVRAREDSATCIVGIIRTGIAARFRETTDEMKIIANAVSHEPCFISKHGMLRYLRIIAGWQGWPGTGSAGIRESAGLQEPGPVT
jgi:hypothetical protein